MYHKWEIWFRTRWREGGELIGKKEGEGQGKRYDGEGNVEDREG